jgi:hypothetical protein
MTPDRETMYGGLLGKLSFNIDKLAAGLTQAEIDAAWQARFPQPEPPSNVIDLAQWKASRELPAD